jgi:parallel beta-helix repeat protein
MLDMKHFVRSLLALVFLLGATPAFGQDEPEPLNVFYGDLPDVETIYYVSLDGDDTSVGSEAAPFRTLRHAISQVRRGEAIVVRGGVYYETGTISFQNNGLPDQMITLTAYPGEVPIFDFSQAPQVSNQHGFRINVSFWHVIGLTVRYAGHNGIRMDGSYNILEQMTAYGNDDTGIHMAGSASNNLILNSDSFRNFNQTDRTSRLGNNADGFGAKFGSLGQNNRYFGCRAWENSDDGFDFWEAPNTIVVENSWAFGNGDASVFGNPPNFEGNGNGFKLGGNYVHTPHVVRHSVAFENFGASGNAKGFDFNNNSGAMTLEHNTAYNNGRNYWFPANPPAGGGQPVFLNNVDYISNQIPIIPPVAVEAGNSWQHPSSVTADDFLSLDTELAKGPRQTDGSLPDIPLLRPAPGSFLVDGGVAYGQPFYGSAPDMGAFPFVEGDLVDPWLDRGSSAVIANLRVFDMEAGASWALRNDVTIGSTVYGDADVELSATSGDLHVDGWIQTAFATSQKNYLFTTVEVTLSQPTMVLVAHSDEITTKPSWLSAFEQTDAQLVLNDGGEAHFMTIYRRQAEAGETVSLGRNSIDGIEGVPMYLAMVGRVTLVSSESLPLAGGVRLHQNFPNPFQGETTFSFTLDQPSHVTLRVFDITGREVATLADGRWQGGEHAIRWAPSSIASGVYFARMTADDVTETRRVVVIR